MLSQTKKIQKLKNNSKFTVLENLGEGSYGCVYKVVDNLTKKIYAIKIIPINNSFEGIPPTALREITILKSIKHPNVLTLHNIISKESQIELLLDCCDMDLRKFIQKYREIPQIYNQISIKKIIHQIILGGNYIHSLGILHRDLKPGNVLIDVNTLNTKIGDFGLSRRISLPGRPYTKEVATLWYRPPELLLGSPIYSTGIDVWAIGCILAELILKEPIFEGQSELDELMLMFRIYGTFNDRVYPGFEKVLGVNKAWPKISGVGLVKYLKEHCQIKIDEECFDLIEKLLVVNPLKRISLSDALKHVRIIYFNI